MADGLEGRGVRTEKCGGFGVTGKRGLCSRGTDGQIQRDHSLESSGVFFTILAIHPVLEGELSLQITSQVDNLEEFLNDPLKKHTLIDPSAQKELNVVTEGMPPRKISKTECAKFL